MTSNTRDEPRVPGDARLYVPDHENWDVHVKRGWDKEYCCIQNPGDDYFHLLLAGEIYLQRGSERTCLTCALRHGIITTDRLKWQRSPDS